MSAAVVFAWKSDVVPNAVSDRLTDVQDVEPIKSFAKRKAQSSPLVIANDLIYEFTIRVGGASPFVISRKAKKGKTLFNASLPAFETDPVSGADLENLINAGRNAIDCTVDLTFTFMTFFDVLLEHITRTDADLTNIANPKDQKVVLDTFTTKVTRAGISVDYKQKNESILNIPAKMADFEVKPRDRGQPPSVKLLFMLNFSPFDAVKKEGMRKLIAADWSKLARHGTPAPKGKKLPTTVSLWESNVFFYLMNNVDIDRAFRIRNAMHDRHLTKTPEELSRDLREDIDKHLVTANHWGEDREDVNREAYQHKLSDLFGTLHQKVYLASPVNRLRLIDDFFLETGARNAATKLDKLDRDAYAALALQFGTGHCGEHADVSFSILQFYAKNPNGKVKRVVKTGNANVDHAFVVYDIDVETVIKTITTNDFNTRRDDDGDELKKGKVIQVWDLREAMEKTKPRKGFVMDPYLDRTFTKSTAQDLLDAIDNKSRGITKTHFLAFLEEVPEPTAPLSFGEVDITRTSEAARAKRVPNV